MKPFGLPLILALGYCLATAGSANASPTIPVVRSDQAIQARALEEQAADLAWAGDSIRAMKTYRDALTQWQALDNIDGIIRSRTAIFSLLREVGTPKEQAAWLSQTREIWAAYQATAKASGVRPGTGYWRSQLLLSHSILVNALEMQPADLAAAENALREVRRDAAKLPADEQLRWKIALRNLDARVHLAQGDLAGAARLLQAPLPAYAALGEDRDSIREVAQSWYLAAQTVQKPEHWPEALAQYQEALKGFHALGQVRWIQSCLEEMAEVCHRAGRETLARQFQLRLDAQRRSFQAFTAAVRK